MNSIYVSYSITKMITCLSYHKVIYFLHQQLIHDILLFILVSFHYLHDVMFMKLQTCCNFCISKSYRIKYTIQKWMLLHNFLNDVIKMHQPCHCCIVILFHFIWLLQSILHQIQCVSLHQYLLYSRTSAMLVSLTDHACWWIPCTGIQVI